MQHPLINIIEQHKQGRTLGIYSVCSANPYVLQAVFRRARADGSLVLVEATSNQVNQFGGYTGQTPKDFKETVYRLCQETGLDCRALTLGGDHLGLNTYQHLPQAQAMDLAREQVAAFVEAGFQKIHLDASMPVADDREITAEVVAERTAELCLAAEQAAPESAKPFYIIGSDVPPPGGAMGETHKIHVTTPAEVEQTIELTRQAFEKHGLFDAWQRVRALVVQPGVEFGDQQIFEYNPQNGAPLKNFIETQPQFVYEAHSTDYQTAHALKRMVQDHFAILKVGPALTFAFREAVFALAFIEQELERLHKNLISSNLFKALERVMLNKPDFWIKHYQGSEEQQAFARFYSLSDRIRYYWPKPTVQHALNRLLENLQHFEIPLTLISQFLPDCYRSIRLGKIENNPLSIIDARIQTVLQDYIDATGMRGSIELLTTGKKQLTSEQL